MKTLYAALLIVFAIFGCNDNKNSRHGDPTKNNDNTPPTDIRHKIANAHGFEHWKNVEEIKFTFNVDRNKNQFTRSWSWQPKSGDVILISISDTIAYNRANMDSITQKTDAAFINDKYWLLAPFQLVWDEGITYSEKNNAIAPVSKDTMNQLTIVYGNDGGYTPGDAYDFFYDKNFKLREWNYRKENAEKPTMSTTWEDYKNFSGIEIATMHKDSTDNFKLFFTDISMKTETEK